MSEPRPAYLTPPVRVVTVVTLEVSREWAALLTMLQRESNAGADWLLVNPRKGLVARVGEMARAAVETGIGPVNES